MSDSTAAPRTSLSDQTVRVQQLFVKHELALRAFILSLEPSFSDAEDILQESFLVITRKANEFQLGSNFFAWAGTIARFKLLEARRRRARTAGLSEEVIAALAAAAPEEPFVDSRLPVLQRCLEQLAPKARELMRLRYHGEHSPAEIAQRVSWSPNAVRVALSRARDALQNCIERTMNPEQV